MSAIQTRYGARTVCVALTALWLAGCVSSSVQKGIAIGAGTGAVLGAGTGVLISSKDLAGSSDGKGRGDITLAPAPTILSAALVGAVLGSVVGAMVGKSNEHEDPGPEAPGSPSARLAPRAF